MKTANDPRHQKRIAVVQELFTWQFNPQSEFNQAETKQIIENIQSIDEIIQKAAPEWPLKQVNKVDLSVLRLAVHELLQKDQTPYKVIVDEAIEIAKQYGSESSSSFINGVLGKIINQMELSK